MPQPLDTPSPLSPSGVDSQSSAASGSEATTLLSGGSKDITQSIKRMSLRIDPSLTRHDLDYLMHVMESGGLVERYGKEGFERELAEAVRGVAGSVGRVMSSRGLR